MGLRITFKYVRIVVSKARRLHLQVVAIVSDSVAQSRDNLSLNIVAVPVDEVRHEHHRVHDVYVVLPLCQVVIQAAALARFHHLRHEKQAKPSGPGGGGRRHQMSNPPPANQSQQKKGYVCLQLSLFFYHMLSYHRNPHLWIFVTVFNCCMRWWKYMYIYALLCLPLYSSRNLDPGSHSRRLPPPTLRYMPYILSRARLQPFLPSSTRVELRLPALDAVNS